MGDTAIQKNIKAILDHGNETRKLLRGLEKEYKQIEVLRKEMEMLKKQVTTLFGKI